MKKKNLKLLFVRTCMLAALGMLFAHTARAEEATTTDPTGKDIEDTIQTFNN